MEGTDLCAGHGEWVCLQWRMENDHAIKLYEHSDSP